MKFSQPLCSLNPVRLGVYCYFSFLYIFDEWDAGLLRGVLGCFYGVTRFICASVSMESQHFTVRTGEVNFSFMINTQLTYLCPHMAAYLALAQALSTTSGDTGWPALVSEMPSAVCCVVDMEHCYSCVPACSQPWSCACVCWTSSQQPKWQVLVRWKKYCKQKKFSKTSFLLCLFLLALHWSLFKWVGFCFSPLESMSRVQCFFPLQNHILVDHWVRSSCCIKFKLDGTLGIVLLEWN